MRDVEKIVREKMHKEKSLEPMDSSMPMRAYLPSLFLNADVLPEMKSWKTGQEYTLKLRVRMTEYTERAEKSLESTHQESHAQFDITGVEVWTKKSK